MQVEMRLVLQLSLLMGQSVASCSVSGGVAIVEIGQTTLVFLPQIHVFAYPFCHVEMNFT